jgi:hypothetical protein
MNRLSYYANKIPNHIVICKCLWVGNISVDIDHIDNDLRKPLNYEPAFKKMLNKLGIEYNQSLHQTPEAGAV